MSSKNELRVLLIDLLSGESRKEFLGGARVLRSWAESGCRLSLAEARSGICGCSVAAVVADCALEVLK